MSSKLGSHWAKPYNNYMVNSNTVRPYNFNTSQKPSSRKSCVSKPLPGSEPSAYSRPCVNAHWPSRAITHPLLTRTPAVS